MAAHCSTHRGSLLPNTASLNSSGLPRRAFSCSSRLHRSSLLATCIVLDLIFAKPPGQLSHPMLAIMLFVILYCSANELLWATCIGAKVSAR